MNKKTGLEKNVFTSDNTINEENNSFRSYEEKLERDVMQLAERFPLKDLKDLKALLEEFDSIELVAKELEKSEERNKDPQEEMANEDVFDYPSLPVEQENIFLKDAIIALYRDYLKKIKETEKLKLELHHSQQKLKRVECLHTIIKES